MRIKSVFQISVAVLLSAAILFSLFPITSFTANAEFDTKYAVYDPYEQFLKKADEASAPNGERTVVDYAGINFSAKGSYYSAATGILDNTYRENGRLWLSKVDAADQIGNNNNCNLVVDSDYNNAIGSRQAVNTSGGSVTLTFTAPLAGDYLIVPRGIDAAAGKSLYLYDPQHYEGEKSEYFKQTITITKGGNTLFTKTLQLNNYMPASDNIPDDIKVSLAANEKLDFTFIAGDNWGRTTLLANFEIWLVEYSAEAVSGVYFEKSNYLAEKDEAFKLSPVIVPASAAEQGVSYKDYDKDILTVESDGSVKAKKAGITKVTAVTKDGGFTAETTVCIYDNTEADIYKLDSLFSGAVALFEGVGEYTNKVNNIESAWQVKYKADDYVKCERVSYEPWGGGNYGIVFSPEAALYASSAPGLVQYMSSGRLVSELKYGRQDSLPHGSALEFTAPKNGVYSITSERTVKLSDATVSYMNGDDNAKQSYFTVKFMLNGVLLSSLNLDYTRQEAEMPVLNGLQLNAGDTLTVTLETDIWEKGGVDISPVVIRVLDKIPEKPVTGVSLDREELELYQSESTELIAKVTPENASNKNVIFASSNPNVAAITENGVVKALLPGTATITASSAENPNIKAVCRVTVKKQKEVFSPTEELWRDAVDAIKNDNESIRYSYDGHFTAGSKNGGVYNDFPYAVKTNWGNPRAVILTNDKTENGSALAKQTLSFYDNTVEIGSYTDASSVYIGFKAKEDGLYTLSPDSAECLIKLTTPSYTNPSELVEWGEDKPFFISITKNGNQIWPSGNTGYELRPGGKLSVAVPTIKNIRLYKGDTLRIEVSGQSGIPNRHATVTFNFNVTFNEAISPDVPVDRVELQQKLYELSIGETAELKTRIYPENADNKNIRYVSADPDTVSVDGTGVITGFKAGKTTVYAVSEDNGNIRDACNVTVTSFKIIDYTPDELESSLSSQLGGAVVTNSLEAEYDTNWSFEFSADAMKSWTPLKMMNTYDWRNENIVSAYIFSRSSQETAGLERIGMYYQPFIATDNADMSLTFTATRSGTYRISPDIRNNRIYVPDTYVNGRIPKYDMDKVFRFAIYRNDTVLFEARLSGNNPTVNFPEISEIFLNSGDNIRFTLSDSPDATSQIDLYFSPVISLVKPDPIHRDPRAEDQSFELLPGEKCSGKMKAVSPNGYSLSFSEETGADSGTLVLGNDGSFTYTSSVKGIFEKKVRVTDQLGKFCTVRLTFLVADKYDCVDIISKLLLEADKKGAGNTGTAKPVSFDNSVWKFQYTYDGLSYANGAPKYYSTDLAEITVNNNWWGYVTYNNDTPQAWVLAVDGVPAFEIMAGNKPWGTNPIGAASFFAPNDATYLLKPSDLFDYFKLTADVSKPEFKQPVKVWIVKNGKKIWPQNSEYIELSKQTMQTDFPTLTVAMHRGDTLRICVSGHYDNERLNTVAFCPIMYDIGAYKSSLDPNPEPEGGKVITDDDGEPMLDYGKFKVDAKSYKMLNSVFSAPITDKKLLSKNKLTLSSNSKFEVKISWDSVKDAAAYKLTVYCKSEDGYVVFAQEVLEKCEYTLSSLTEGEYTVQVEALDKYSQTLEIYRPADFKVNADGSVKIHGNMGLIWLLIGIGTGIILVTAGILIVIKRRKPIGGSNA